MKSIRKIALAIVPVLVLCAAPLAWNAAAESGTVGEDFTWTIEEDVLTISAVDGSFDMICEDSVMRITGTSFRLFEDELTEEDEEAMRPVFEFAESFDVEKVVIDVDELLDGIPFMQYAGEINIELTDRVSYVAEDTLHVPAYSVVTVRSRELSLDGSGLGYDADGDAMVLGIRGYVDSPAETYAASEGAFEFFPLEGSGQWDADGLVSWEIQDDLLTIYANDGSYQMTITSEEILVTGTAFTGMPELAFLDGSETLLLYVLEMEDLPDRVVFEVESIDSPEVGLNSEGMDIILTETVQSICEDGLCWVDDGTDVYVESRDLELAGCGLLADEGGITVHGYADSPAQAYAEENGLTFVAFDEPEETTTSEATTTTEETTTTEATTTEETTTEESTTSTTTTEAETTTTTSETTTTTEEGEGEYAIALLSLPDTGDKSGIGILAAAGMTALLGGCICRKKQ